MSKTDASLPISRAELIALLAMLMATIAFAIDAMLPALPAIGAEINPADPQRAQLVIAAFVTGMGVGTLFAGPLSDAFGRRTIAVGGSAIYIAAALYAATASDLTALLFARAAQGLGAAGPRVVTLAIIRDLFSSRQMARISSLVITVFTLVPVFAPTVGAGIAWAFGWRAIFLAFGVFSLIATTWLLTRLPETLAPERRRPFTLAKLAAGIREVFGSRQVVLAIVVQTLMFGILFSALLSTQAVFGGIYSKTESFPLWFGLMAAISATSSLLNATVVVRFGMRSVIKWGLIVQSTVTLTFLSAQLTLWHGAAPPFAAAFLFMTSLFYLIGFGIGNLNAIALEPMGHMAGMASSVIAATSTVASIFLAAPVGQAFDGTMIPLTLAELVFCVTAFLLVLRIREVDATITGVTPGT